MGASTNRRRPTAPPAILLHPAAGIAWFAFAVAATVGVAVDGGAGNVGLLVLLFSLDVAAAIVTAWDRRSLGRSALCWTLGVLVFHSAAYAIYTLWRRRAVFASQRATAASGGGGAGVPIWLVGVGFALVAVACVRVVAAPVLIASLLIAAGAMARRRVAAGAALFAAALALPALAAGFTVGAVKPYRIPSASMAPTLRPNDRILVAENGGFRPRRGEIVAFHPPAGELSATCGVPIGPHDLCPTATPQTATAITVVKRVVGLPGDAIAFRHGLLVRNGVVQHESFTLPCGSGFGCSFRPRIIVAPGHYFVLGDNRGNSDDSRFFGPVPASSLVGPVIARYWPVGRIGAP